MAEFGKNWRNSIFKLAPSWLVGTPQSADEGEFVWYSLMVTLDAFLRRAELGLIAKFPTYAPTDAFPYLSRDRRILRGRDETDAQFAIRLKRYLDDHRTRGNPFAMMEQIRAYLGVDVLCRTVDARGNWYTIATDGTYSTSLDTGNWEWDDDAASQWSRFWVIIYPDATLGPWFEQPYAIGSGSLWGGAIGTAGYTIGTTATPDEVAAIRSLVQTWKPAGTTCEWIIISFDPDAWDPSDPEPVNGDHEEDVRYSAHLTLDGTDDHVDHGNSLDFSFEWSDQFTLSMWVETTDTTAMLMSKMDVAPTVRGWAISLDGTGKAELELINDASSSSQIRVTSPAAINDGQRHHLLWRYDGSQAAAGVALSLDGVDVTLTESADNLSGTIKNSLDVLVGAYTGGQYLAGNVGTYAIWDSYILDRQALSVWARGPGGDLTSLSPLLWTKIVGSTYPTITDYGSGGHDGTLTNGAADDIVDVAVSARLLTARYWRGTEAVVL